MMARDYDRPDMARPEESLAYLYRKLNVIVACDYDRFNLVRFLILFIYLYIS